MVSADAALDGRISTGRLRGEREFRDPMDATPYAVRQRGGQTRWGSTSPLEAHAPWLLKLIAEHPDPVQVSLAGKRDHQLHGWHRHGDRLVDRREIV